MVKLGQTPFENRAQAEIHTFEIFKNLYVIKRSLIAQGKWESDPIKFNPNFSFKEILSRSGIFGLSGRGLVRFSNLINLGKMRLDNGEATSFAEALGAAILETNLKAQPDGILYTNELRYFTPQELINLAVPEQITPEVKERISPASESTNRDIILILHTEQNTKSFTQELRKA